MTLVQQDRINAGIGFDWDSLPRHRTSLADLAHDAEELCFRRERSSHRGIHRFQCLRRLWLYHVNQEFLEEVCELPAVEQLFIDRLTATDLTPLRRLQRLRRLILQGGTKIQDLDWVTGLAPLEALAIENFKRVFHLDALVSLTSLSALGIEGSMWTTMRVASLAPLSQLHALRFLFLTNLRTSDRSLRHLYSLRGLEVLDCAATFPDEEFVCLRKALPRLRCDWFDMVDQYGSIREGMRRIFGAGPDENGIPPDDTA